MTNTYEKKKRDLSNRKPTSADVQLFRNNAFCIKNTVTTQFRSRTNKIVCGGKRVPDVKANCANCRTTASILQSDSLLLFFVFVWLCLFDYSTSFLLTGMKMQILYFFLSV